MFPQRELEQSDLLLELMMVCVSTKGDDTVGAGAGADDGAVGVRLPRLPARLTTICAAWSMITGQQTLWRRARGVAQDQELNTPV